MILALKGRIDSWLEADVGRADLAGAAHLQLISGVVQLRPEDAVLEAMLRGWRAQQTARGLREDTIAPRERLMRRFVEFTNEYPWCWLPGHVDEWTQSLMAESHLAPSTIRGYQTDLRLFSEYLCDARYGWAAMCQEQFGPGVHPVPICHEWNTIAHLNDYEGNPEARPFSRTELQRFLDYADEQVDRAVRAKRKGALAAYRDATLFKVVYAWGLRRTETSKLDVLDWGRNPAAPEFGRFGMLHVRYGKAVRGQPPRRRNVPSVMGWAVEAVADYVDNIRPRFGCEEHPAMWLTERGGRVAPAEINARFVAYRDTLGLPKTLTPHSLRHSWVTHLTEDGVDRRFIQEAVGHRCDTSTAIYTHVSGDFMNTALRKALGPAFDDHTSPASEGELNGAQTRLPLAPAPGHGRARHVRHHRPDRAAGAARDPPVLQPGVPAGRGTPRAAEPEDPDGAVRHPGLRHGRADRTDRRGNTVCKEAHRRRRRRGCWLAATETGPHQRDGKLTVVRRVRTRGARRPDRGRRRPDRRAQAWPGPVDDHARRRGDRRRSGQTPPTRPGPDRPASSA